MIIIKSPEEIKIIREGGKILAAILADLLNMVKPGLTTLELEKRACFLMEKAGARPSFKGYKTGKDRSAFPTALCVSINDEVVHAPALPSREIKDGDIVSIDAGLEYKKLFTDMAASIGAGKISEDAEKLIRVTRECLYLAIKQVKPGNTLTDIARAIQTHAEENNFSVVRELVGHGVGKAVHEDPQIPNYVIDHKNFKEVILKTGMVLAIEPMVNMGGWKVEEASDGFSIVTADLSLSAHFEHTIAVTEKGGEILTRI
jgi:methionyl aminopeptidase